MAVLSLADLAVLPKEYFKPVMPNSRQRTGRKYRRQLTSRSGPPMVKPPIDEATLAAYRRAWRESADEEQHAPKTYTFRHSAAWQERHDRLTAMVSELLTKGTKQKTICKELGISTGTLQRIMHELRNGIQAQS